MAPGPSPPPGLQRLPTPPRPGGGLGPGAIHPNSHSQAAVRPARAEIVRSLGASVRQASNWRDGRVTARHFTKENVQVAESGAQTVTVRTATGQELAYPWATSVRVDRR